MVPLEGLFLQSFFSLCKWNFFIYLVNDTNCGPCSDAIKTTLQATKGEKLTSFMVFNQIVAKDGILGLWKMCHYRGFSSAYEKLVSILLSLQY